MTIKEEIFFNQFCQGIFSEEKLITFFLARNAEQKRKVLNDLVHLMTQSKITEGDVNYALKNSKLKPTYTPCILIRKGLTHGTFQKIIALPEHELCKSFKLFIHLFKIGYLRRYEEEKGNPSKWWYWDLSKEENLQQISTSF